MTAFHQARGWGEKMCNEDVSDYVNVPRVLTRVVALLTVRNKNTNVILERWNALFLSKLFN